MCYVYRTLLQVVRNDDATSSYYDVFQGVKIRHTRCGGERSCQAFECLLMDRFPFELRVFLCQVAQGVVMVAKLAMYLLL